MKRNYKHIQFWDRPECSPSRADALFALSKALDLLSSALPLAMKAIVGAEPHEQLLFWWDFIDFEKETDIDGRGGYGPINMENLRCKLSNWATLSRERIDNPREDLRDDAGESRK